MHSRRYTKGAGAALTLLSESLAEQITIDAGGPYAHVSAGEAGGGCFQSRPVAGRSLQTQLRRGFRRANEFSPIRKSPTVVLAEVRGP
jgi:hypothetical protein